MGGRFGGEARKLRVQGGRGRHPQKLRNECSSDGAQSFAVLCLFLVWGKFLPFVEEVQNKQTCRFCCSVIDFALISFVLFGNLATNVPFPLHSLVL